jgi:hypothetical protein
MSFQRHGPPAIRFVSIAGLIVVAAAIIAPAAAQDDLSTKPPLPPEPSALSPSHAGRLSPLVVTVIPLGAAVQEKPLPVGATPTLRIGVRNAGAGTLLNIVLAVRIEGMKVEDPSGWRAEGGAWIAEISGLDSGEESEHTLKLRIDSAPPAAKTNRVGVEARFEGGLTASAEAVLRAADCVGAYQAKLAPLRTEVAPAIRTAAEQTYRRDPALPTSRLIPPTGARTGNLANAEKLAAALSANGGADPEMGREWFRFLIQRFASELSNYAGQEANPGLCAANDYQITGYREGLLPLMKRLDAVRTAAGQALEAARATLKAGNDEDLDLLARRIAQAIGLEAREENASVFAILAAARALLKNRALDQEQAEALSLIETAAWLAESERRGQALVNSFETAYATISTAHGESCVCAF